MRTRYRVTTEDGIYFITSTIVEWIPIFILHEYFEIMLDAFNYCRQNKDLKIYAYVIMDNHFHLVASGPDLALIIQSLKRHTAKQIVSKLQTQKKQWLLNQLSFYKKKHKAQSKYQVWQEGFHPQLIENEEMFIQKLEYIHYNPVRRGYVDNPEHWRYSSARNYALSDERVLEIDDLTP
jgi:putative transposase